MRGIEIQINTNLCEAFTNLDAKVSCQVSRTARHCILLHKPERCMVLLCQRQMHLLHLCPEWKSGSGMKGGPSDIAEIASPRSNVVHLPLSAFAGQLRLCRPTSSRRRLRRPSSASLSVYLLSDVPSRATCAPHKKWRPGRFEHTPKPYHTSGEA